MKVFVICHLSDGKPQIDPYDNSIDCYAKRKDARRFLDKRELVREFILLNPPRKNNGRKKVTK